MEGLWSVVNSVISSKTYILGDEYDKKFWLVDCGDIDNVFGRLNEVSKGDYVIEGVLLTHAHYDHIYGIPRLTERFHNVKIYTNENGKAVLANERLNLSRYHRDPINYISENVVVCNEGETIDLFDEVSALVYYTPGHHPSCLTYLIGDSIFTGDSYIPGSDVVTKLPGGNRNDALVSLARIKKLAENRIIFPGHVEGVKSSLFGLI